MNNEYKLNTLASMSHSWLANQKSLLPVRVAQALYAGVKGFFNQYTVDINSVVNKQLAKDNGNSYFGQFVKKIRQRKAVPQQGVPPQVIPVINPIDPHNEAAIEAAKKTQILLGVLNQCPGKHETQFIESHIDLMTTFKEESTTNADVLIKALNENSLIPFLTYAQSIEAEESNQNTTRANDINIQIRRLINLGLDVNNYPTFNQYLNKVKNCKTCTAALETYNKKSLQSELRDLKKALFDSQKNHSEKLKAFSDFMKFKDTPNIQLNDDQQKEFITLLQEYTTKHFNAFLEDQSNNLKADEDGAILYRLILDELGENYKLTDENTKNLEKKIDHISRHLNLFDDTHQNSATHTMRSNALKNLVIINKEPTSFFTEIIKAVFKKMQPGEEYLDSSFRLCHALRDAGVDLYGQQFATNNDIKNHPHYTALLQALKTENDDSLQFIKELSNICFPLTNELVTTIKDQLSQENVPITDIMERRLILLRPVNTF